jgi:hypothetical protein
MTKLPIGPIMIALALLGLIGAFLLFPAKKPAVTETFSVVSAPGTDANVAQFPAHAMAGAPTAPTPAVPTLTPGEDPPVHREPGAINYADKGVVPAL